MSTAPSVGGVTTDAFNRAYSFTANGKARLRLPTIHPGADLASPGDGDPELPGRGRLATSMTILLVLVLLGLLMARRVHWLAAGRGVNETTW